MYEHNSVKYKPNRNVLHFTYILQIHPLKIDELFYIVEGRLNCGVKIQ
jgi:hypothetical protein